MYKDSFKTYNYLNPPCNCAVGAEVQKIYCSNVLKQAVEEIDVALRIVYRSDGPSPDRKLVEHLLKLQSFLSSQL